MTKLYIEITANILSPMERDSSVIIKIDIFNQFSLHVQV